MRAAHRPLLIALLALATSLLACDRDSSGDRPEKPVNKPVETVEPEKPTPPPAPAGPKVNLVRTEGQVEVSRDGKWTPASVGELHENDAVRTTGKGSANVAIGDVQVEVKEDSQVTVGKTSAKVANLKLEQGRISADMAETDMTLRIGAANTDAVAEAQEGSFSVFGDGRGLVAVASKTSEVTLSTSGGDVVLAAGEFGRAVADAAPEKRKLRKSVLLSVNWPGARKTRARKTTITGTTEAGTAVAVNGKVVPVDQDGSFEAEVPLSQGRNAVKVEATDLMGRTTSKSRRIEVERTPPKVEADTENLWDK